MSPESFMPQKERKEIPETFNIAVLVSPISSGSNLKAIYASQEDSDIRGRVSLVIADREGARPFEFAIEKDIPIHVARFKIPKDMDPEEYRDIYSEELANILNKNNIDIAVMAGFNRILNLPFFEEFKKPIINIHPGAIPDLEDGTFVYEGFEIPWNRGLQREDAVKNFLYLPYAFSTIHIATKETDFGQVLKRVFVKVEEGDDVDSLYERLKLEEHKGLIEVFKNPPL